MKLLTPCAALVAVLLFPPAVRAQGPTVAPRPVATPTAVGTRLLLRKTVWRQLDLRERQNKPLFARGREISRFILEAAKRGELPAYRSDSLASRLTPGQVAANMSYDFNGLSSGAGDDWSGSLLPPDRCKCGVISYDVQPALEQYRYKDLYELELKEEVVFDQQLSRQRYEIKALSLHVPAGLYGNASGVDKPIASFRYADLVQLFRRHPDTALWINPDNEAQHHNLADAFALRLFSSYITKVSNAGDQRLDELAPDARQGILVAQPQAAELVEHEYSLWAY